jgi:hypothetical protein
VVIEAGVVAGYVISWAVRKAQRAAGRLDAGVDAVMDAGLDKLHTVVAGKLSGHPVLAELAEEAADDGGDGGGQVSELTRQQVELAVTAAARKDDGFARAVTELVAQLRAAEQAAGGSVVAGAGSRVFTGDAHAQASGAGIAFGQVGGDVHLSSGAEVRKPRAWRWSAWRWGSWWRQRPGPSPPGRSSP